MSEIASRDQQSPPPKHELLNKTAGPPLSKTHSHDEAFADLASDIVLWRRKKLNVLILVAATATWTLMEVYHYHFITLLSWLAMALVASLFFWGTMHRFLKKEAPDLSELEISEETAIQTAELFKHGVEELIRLMVHVSSEREWYVFAGVETALYIISVVAARLDFLTLCYIGIVGVMTIPVIYVKEEGKIREVGQNLRIKLQRLHSIVEEKFRKMKSKIGGKGKEIKEKKQE